MNVFVGDKSGQNTYTGFYNLFLGAESGFNNFASINNVYLGYQSGYNETDKSAYHVISAITSSGLDISELLPYVQSYQEDFRLTYETIFGQFDITIRANEPISYTHIVYNPTPLSQENNLTYTIF